MSVAIGRLSVGIGKKGRARKHAEYILRLGKYEPKPVEKQTKSDKNLEDIIASSWGNMPAWSTDDPLYFFQCADEFERKNGSTYREHVIALPRELTDEKNIQLVESWIAKEIGEQHAYAYAIHKPMGLDGLPQPHVHLMFSDRKIDGYARDPDRYFKRYNSTSPDKGGAKKARTGMKPSEMKTELKEQRERWELLCNEHLKNAGSDARISMASLRSQGIDRQPINLHMSEIQQPKTKQLYQAQLLAKRELELAELDLTLNVPDIRAELERQRTLPRPQPQIKIKDDDETDEIADNWIIEQAKQSVLRITQARNKEQRTDEEQEQVNTALWVLEQVQNNEITDELREQSLEYAREQQRANREQNELASHNANSCSSPHVTEEKKTELKSKTKYRP